MGIVMERGGGKYLSRDGEMKKKLPQAVFPQHLEGEIKFPALLKNFFSSRGRMVWLAKMME